MQQALQHSKRLPWVIALGAAGAFFLRGVLAALALQVLAGYLLVVLALPLCRLLERRMKPGTAAALSLLGLAAVGVLLLLGVVPPLARHIRQLAESFPALLEGAQAVLVRLQEFLQARGLDLTIVRDELFSQVSQRAGAVVTGAAQAVTQAVQAAGKLILAPLLAFYLLRDRRRIASALALLAPVPYRARCVRAAREMRRETANFLRGQLLLSLAVGALTALGLMLTGTPAALALGLLMGVMELIPYLGPVIAGVPAVLVALQGGYACALWTLAVLLAVQQVESSLLSPRLLSGATRLHPLAVLLAVSAGGMLGGALGMLLALPAVVSLRGMLRGLRA